MLHYIDPTDKSTWPPEGSYFYARLKSSSMWDEDLYGYILERRPSTFYSEDYFVEASGERYLQFEPEDIEYWMPFKELDECIELYQKFLSQKFDFSQNS